MSYSDPWGQAVTAFIIFSSSACAVIASLERILGPSIPRFRYSPAIPKGRVFVAVPVLMVAVFVVLNSMLFAKLFFGDRYIWPHPGIMLQISIFIVGISGVVGWIIFAGLLLMRLVFRVLSRFSKLTRHNRQRAF